MCKVVEVFKHADADSTVLRFEGNKQECECYVLNNWYRIWSVYVGHSKLVIKEM